MLVKRPVSNIRLQRVTNSMSYIGRSSAKCGLNLLTRPAVYKNQIHKSLHPHNLLPNQRKAKSRAKISAWPRCAELHWV